MELQSAQFILAMHFRKLPEMLPVSQADSTRPIASALYVYSSEAQVEQLSLLCNDHHQN